MTPMFFGQSQSALFGVLHRADPSTDGKHGVILCPSVGQDHMRTYGLVRTVAERLAQAGFHALRFDWFGVGDSAADLQAATLERWLDDVSTAADELREQTEVRHVSAFSLRLGAPMAMLGAQRAKLRSIVLWDPVADGATFLRQQRRLSRTLIRDPNRFWQPSPNLQLAENELVGYVYAPKLLEQLNGLTAEDLVAVGSAAVHLLHSPREDVSLLHACLSSAGVSVKRVGVPMVPEWDDVTSIERRVFAGPLGPAVVQALLDAS